MTSSTRRLLAGSAFVVAVGVATGLVAYYSGVGASRNSWADLSYLPADVSGVAYADVRDIMTSGFSRQVRQLMPTGEERNRLLEDTGIDIERDIDTVVAGFSGTAPGGSVVLLRGRFDRGRIETLATSQGARAEQYGGRALFVGMQGGGPSADGAVDRIGEDAALAFLEDDLLALGAAPAVRRAIDTAGGGASVTSNADVMRFIERTRDSGNAWFVGRAGEWLGVAAPVPGEVRSQFDAIDWLAVSAEVAQDLHGIARAEVRDSQSADELRTVLAGALAAFRMMAAQDSALASAVNSIQVTGSGRDIELSFTIPAAALEVIQRSMTDAPLAR